MSRCRIFGTLHLCALYVDFDWLANVSVKKTEECATIGMCERKSANCGNWISLQFRIFSSIHCVECRVSSASTLLSALNFIAGDIIFFSAAFTIFTKRMTQIIDKPLKKMNFILRHELAAKNI